MSVKVILVHFFSESELSLSLVYVAFVSFMFSFLSSSYMYVFFNSIREDEQTGDDEAKARTSKAGYSKQTLLYAI
jgi:hypothetical protein